MFPQRCLSNSSSVCLTDDGPLSSFQGRSSTASSFHASLFQAIDSVVLLASFSQVVSQAPQHFNLPRSKPLVRVALPASPSDRSFPFTPGQLNTPTGVLEGECRPLTHSRVFQINPITRYQTKANSGSFIICKAHQHSILL